MNTANVYDHPTVSWEKAKIAFDQIERKEGELLTHWVELGQQLIMLRKSNPANKDFGAACEEHGIELTHQRRKAAMWWAGLSQDQRETLREYNPAALHPATLENRCREQFPEWLTSTRAVLHSVEDGEPIVPEAEITAETAPEPSETSQATEQKSEHPIEEVKSEEDLQVISSNTRSLLVSKVGIDAATKIFSCWQNQTTRQSFNVIVKQSGGPGVIKRIADLTDQCKKPITVNVNAYAKGKSFSHRLFVPSLPRSWANYYGTNWDNLKAIKVILDQIPDAIRMNQELGDVATLEECNHWWKNRGNPEKQKPANNPVFMVEPNLEAFSTPTAVEHTHQPAHGAEAESIRVHGKQIWPNELADYEFIDAWAAFHLWQDLTRHMIGLKDEGAESRSRFLMEMHGWLMHCSVKFAKAFHKITAAEHSHPEKYADTICPPKLFKTK